MPSQLCVVSTQMVAISSTFHDIITCYRKINKSFDSLVNMLIIVKLVKEIICSDRSDTQYTFDRISELRLSYPIQKMFIVVYPTTF